MIRSDIPFKFDVADLLARARRQVSGRLGNVSISLPFISFSVSPKSKERQIAREIVIRLRDRRVLSAWECCDRCIDEALSSLKDIRKLLVEKQVELSDFHDGALFLVVDTMGSGIRQFMTFEESLRTDERWLRAGTEPFYRDPDKRESYLDALEILRGHLSRCLGQIAVIGGMPALNEGVIAHYQGPWQLEAYSLPPGIP